MIFKNIPISVIREKAEGIRKQYWSKDTIPINIENIIEFKLGIGIIPIPNLKSQHDIEGMLSKDLTSIFVDSITVSDPRFLNRLRFTLAHELGHYILHREFYNQVEFDNADSWIAVLQGFDETDLDWYERHANEFAGRLLVPEHHLINEINLLKSKIKDLKQIAEDKGFEKDEIDERIKTYIGNFLAKKFEVSSQVIEARLRLEKIDLKAFYN